MDALDAALLGSPLVNGHISALEIAQEREIDTGETSFTCPDILWQGVFAKVADHLKQRNFEVWLGVLCALAARAHRNVHWLYHRPIYGMVYGLLIAPTGSGKGLCTDVCRALLPTWYTVRSGVQSGPGLALILAKVTREKGKIIAVEPRPAMLVSEEFSAILKMAAIENSTLKDALNEIFHTREKWNITKSEGPGGGDLVINQPTLSICATTTKSLLREYLSEKDIRSGFLNRYLVMPGTRRWWRFHDREQAGIDTYSIRSILDDIPAYPWGLGQNLWDAYEPEAEAQMAAWGERELEPLMNMENIESETVKRMHVYAHVTALLYAWSERTPRITCSHVAAATAAITISRDFIFDLMGKDAMTSMPLTKKYELELDDKIIARIRSHPLLTSRDYAARLRKTAPYDDILSRLKRLIVNGQVKSDKRGKTDLLSVVEDAQV